MTIISSVLILPIYFTYNCYTYIGQITDIYDIIKISFNIGIVVYNLIIGYCIYQILKHITIVLPPPNTAEKSYKKRWDKDPENCTICLNSIEKESFIYDLKCGHNFHDKCLDTWVDYSSTCPLCSEVININ